MNINIVVSPEDLRSFAAAKGYKLIEGTRDYFGNIRQAAFMVPADWLDQPLSLKATIQLPELNTVWVLAYSTDKNNRWISVPPEEAAKLSPLYRKFDTLEIQTDDKLLVLKHEPIQDEMDKLETLWKELGL